MSKPMSPIMKFTMDSIAGALCEALEFEHDNIEISNLEVKVVTYNDNKSLYEIAWTAENAGRPVRGLSEANFDIDRRGIAINFQLSVIGIL